jgi:putative transposase
VKPSREHATRNAQIYLITSSTWSRRALFRNERWAKLLIDTLYKYRSSAYLLHEFVIMPDPIHVLLTPLTSLEKAVQFSKGGFSYGAKKELGSNMEVWQKGFSDHRIRDANDYALHVSYIHQNPVKERYYARPEEFPYSSVHSGFELDGTPQGPKALGEPVTARLEGVPFQSKAVRSEVSAQSANGRGGIATATKGKTA